MTGVIEAPGIGHNQPDPMEMEKKNQKWERWAKKRTFVRALEGTYSHLYKTLKEEKRVYSAQDVPWKGGPHMQAWRSRFSTTLTRNGKPCVRSSGTVRSTT